MRKDNFPVLAEKKLYVVSDASTLDLDRPCAFDNRFFELWKGRNRGVVLQLVGRHCRAYNEVAYRDEQHQERSTHFERLASPSTLEFSWRLGKGEFAARSLPAACGAARVSANILASPSSLEFSW